MAGDADRLHQVFANLLANSRVHTPPGNRVVVVLSSSSTGLGLAIVRAIVESHHGTVQVMSRPGQTSFIVRLPLQPD